MEIIKSDLTVIGGGIAGMCAAVAAARHGLTVTLINDRPVLGGNASSEVGVGICGSGHQGMSASVWSKEGGLVDEIRQMTRWFSPQDGKNNNQAKDTAYFEFIYGEPNITLHLNTLAVDVELDNARIIAVKAHQMGTEKEFRLESALYIDASGDGAIARKAGAPYLYGREGRDQFGESKAPEKADTLTMGSTMMHSVEDTGAPAVYRAPKFAQPPVYDIEKNGLLANLKDADPTKFRPWSPIAKTDWFWEFGGQKDTIGQSEDVALEIRQFIYALFNQVKNVEKTPESANMMLGRIPPVQGKRETRRFIGDHVLTQNDISAKTAFADAVAVGGWPMDIHAPYGIFDGAPASDFFQVPGMFNIPFRSLYSKNIDNLMLAGRNISATHVAFSSTRVMGTGGAMGQAVGMAAALCQKHHLMPRDIARQHATELQVALVKDDQTIVGVPESVGLAQNCRVTASSTLAFGNTKGTEDRVLKLDYGLVLPFPGERLDSLEVWLTNTTDQEQTLSIKVMGGQYKETFIAEGLVKTLDFAVPARHEGWWKLTLDLTRSSFACFADTKAYLVFQRNPALSLKTSSWLPVGVGSLLFHRRADNQVSSRELAKTDPKSALALAFSHEHITHDTKPLDEAKTGYAGFDRTSFNLCFRHVTPSPIGYGPENVLDGWGRPYGSTSLWVADQADKKPVLTLTSDAPLKASELRVGFNSTLESDRNDRISPDLIRHYQVTTTDAQGRSSTLTVRDNHKRLNCLKVPSDLVKVEIQLEETWGSELFSVYQVKLF